MRYQIFKTILQTTDPFPRHDFSPEFTLACIITLFGFFWIFASRHLGSLSSLETMINFRSRISRISQYRPLKLKAEGQPTFSRHTYVGSTWSRHLEGEREQGRDRAGIWTDLNIYDITSEVSNIQLSTSKSDF